MAQYLNAFILSVALEEGKNALRDNDTFKTHQRYKAACHYWEGSQNYLLKSLRNKGCVII